VGFSGVKTKKPVGLTGVFFIIFAHPYSRRELLRERRKPTSSQAEWSVSGMKRLHPPSHKATADKQARRNGDLSEEQLSLREDVK